jgi:hypothetical protein
LGDIIYSPSRFEPGASHQSGADEMLVFRKSELSVFMCPSPIKFTKPTSALSLVGLSHRKP